MRIVLFGDGDWATRSLLRLRDAGHDIAAVVLRARPSENGLEQAATALGVPIAAATRCQCSRVRLDRPRAGARRELVDRLQPDLLDAIRGTASWFLNVHAGKLPRYPRA